VVVATVVALAIAAAPIWASQRSAYGKNGSDWNDIAAFVHSHAVPGDAVVFDEGVRPSRRPRLAMSTNPSPFAAVSDPTLRTAYPDGVTWHDSAYTVPQAAALGRFRSVDRVWVVEYATATGHVDSWGLAELWSLGFHQVDEHIGHRCVLYRYER
jgi:mannosyltransferase